MCLYSDKNQLVHPCAPVLTTRDPRLCMGQTHVEEVSKNIRNHSSWWRRAKLRLYAWGRRTWLRSGISKKKESAGSTKLTRNQGWTGRRPRVGRRNVREGFEQIRKEETRDKQGVKNRDDIRTERQTPYWSNDGRDSTLRIVEPEKDDEITLK